MRDNMPGNPGSTKVVIWSLAPHNALVHLPLVESLVSDGRVSACAIVNKDSDEMAKLLALRIPVAMVVGTRQISQIMLAAFRFPFTIYRLNQFIGTEPVVVHVAMMSPWDAIYLPFIKRRNRALIVTVHDATRHPGEESRFWVAVTDYIMRQADVLAVLSRHVERGLRGRLVDSEKVECVDGGLTIKLGTLGEARRFPQKAARLLFQGRLHHYKGFDIFVEAMELLKATGVAFQPVVAVSGDISEWRQKLDNLGAEVTAESWISEDRLASIVASCDINVLPYREASQSAVVLNSQFLGLPNVVTAVGGLPEQVEDGVDGIVVADVNAGAIAAALQRLISDPNLYEKMSLATINRAKAASAGAVSEKWRALYSKLLQAKGLA